jgi:hypothetical protein
MRSTTSGLRCSTKSFEALGLSRQRTCAILPASCAYVGRPTDCLLLCAARSQGGPSLCFNRGWPPHVVVDRGLCSLGRPAGRLHSICGNGASAPRALRMRISKFLWEAQVLLYNLMACARQSLSVATPW